MSEPAFYQLILVVWLALAAVTFLALFFVIAPYGRHVRKGWGPTLPSRLGWILMESPTLIVFDVLWLTSSDPLHPVGLAFAAIWHLHYVNRTLVFPFRMRGAQGKRMPALVALLAVVFNSGNAYLQAGWIYRLSGGYSIDWLTDPRFLLGLAIFLIGFRVNLRSDAILRNLRKPGDTGYTIPRGGLYRLLSCPNYFGELVEWCGWAVLVWSWGALAFVVWTAANLVPRALQNHAWYHERFADYPPERKAVIPYVL